MILRRLLMLFGVCIAVLAVLHPLIRPRHHAAPQVRTRGGRPAVRRYRLPPVLPGAPGSAHAVLYRFAVAYGSVSGSTVAERNRLLLSLAAPPLSSRLRAAGSVSELTAASRVLRERIRSSLISLELTGTVGGITHGAVVIEQRLWGSAAHAAHTAPPLESSYVAQLVRWDGAWRVSEFSLVP
jgi:hypothetical protein